jgi:FMN phosphatase YigB (HAD superfamily)
MVSFDIFDTVVTRTLARPIDLFEAVGKELRAQGLIQHSPSRFGLQRGLAEKDARDLRADHEPNLKEITARLQERYRWNERQAQVAITTELALERDAIVPLSPIRAWVEAARRAGCAIVFVSDMYLPTEFLREILTRHRIAAAADEILVSNELRTSKHEGGLFRHLLTQRAIPASTVLHVGDHEHSDSRVPHRLGMHALLVRATQLGSLERSHLPFSPSLDLLPSRIAAAARLGRIESAPTVQNQSLNEIGAGLLGPLLASFVLWTFHRARASGVKRLYFVSRDGQVLLETALTLQKRVPAYADIECRYLYGSRIAWHHASLESFTPRHLTWLLNPQPEINAFILAHRLGVDLDLLKACLRSTPAAEVEAKSHWNESDLGLIRAALLSVETKLLQAAKAESRVSLARRYFEQEGLFDGTPWGVVELGWSGSMLTSLYHAIKAPAQLQAFYFGLFREDPSLPIEVNLQSFLVEPHGIHEALGHGLRLAEMLEALTTADHATVLGYQEVGTRIEPSLKNGALPIWAPADLASLRGGSQGFVRSLDPVSLAALDKTTAEPAHWRLLAAYLLSVLCRFTAAPSAELARPFAACSFSEDPADEHRRFFVQPLTWRAALSSSPFPEGELWYQGSLVCSSGTAQALVSGGIPRGLRHLVRRIFQR